jgi:hypothetical protein
VQRDARSERGFILLSSLNLTLEQVLQLSRIKIPFVSVPYSQILITKSEPVLLLAPSCSMT